MFLKHSFCIAVVEKIVKGDFLMGTQYHFSMETLTCIVIPAEDGGLDIYCSTQWVQVAQEAVSLMLNMPEHK